MPVRCDAPAGLPCIRRRHHANANDPGRLGAARGRRPARLAGLIGACCPDDQEYLDIRLTRDNINGGQFVNLLRLLRAGHPDVETFLLYVDGARYYSKQVVKEWLRRHKEFRTARL
jgi:hypothetical protein